MPDRKPARVNTGIYTLAQAAALTGVSRSRIRRWLRGYRLPKRGRNYRPLWQGQLEPIENKLALGFLDLIEIKFVEAFLERGVSWDMIHKARDKAAALFPGESHPFCTRRFMTDGRDVFVQVLNEAGQPNLLELGHSQQVFSYVIDPFLKELDFGNGDLLERWWPGGREHRVALDPKRNFGLPSLFDHGIPTSVLARSARRNSVADVARWYDIDVDAVNEAVEFERRLAA